MDRQAKRQCRFSAGRRARGVSTRHWFNDEVFDYVADGHRETDTGFKTLGPEAIASTDRPSSTPIATAAAIDHTRLSDALAKDRSAGNER